MRIALKIAYDGRSFHGYARQPHLQTIENSLINTFIDHGIFSNPKTSYFQSSSRTDKGVSSFGNVIAFNTKKTINDHIEKCNTSLEKIIIYGFKQVESTFYPRYAKQRIYYYFLHKNDYEFNRINQIVKLFIGTHNFTNFARIEPKKNLIRTIEKIIVEETEKHFIIKFYAQTFLWHQIRRIINAIEQFLKGKRSYEEIYRALIRPYEYVDFGVAKAESLILIDVCYEFQFDWYVQKESFESFKESILLTL
jgi:tRNA pseudouridine38-40 synthase